VEVDVVATSERRSPVPVGHHEHWAPDIRAPRIVALIIYWAPVLLWLGFEIRWRWRRLKARLDLP
jgi:hypothetical protein